MERLTDRTEDGIAYVKSETGVEGVGVSTTQRRLPELIARLAAYEDTGLEPEDLKKPFNEDAILKLAAQYLKTTPDHLKELVQAEKDGQLVVLPKVSEADRKLFAENLHDVFTEWANDDPSVGIFGMSEGERALAAAIMKALAPDKAEAALAEKGEPGA